MEKEYTILSAPCTGWITKKFKVELERLYYGYFWIEGMLYVVLKEDNNEL